MNNQIQSYSNDNNSNFNSTEAAIARQGLISRTGFAPRQRSIFSHKMDNHAPSFTNLVTMEETRDFLVRSEALMQPRDITVSLNQLAFNFDNGTCDVHILRAGKDGRRIPMETLRADGWAFSQLCGYYDSATKTKFLPAYGNGFIRSLVGLRPPKGITEEQHNQMVAGYRKMAASTMMAFGANKETQVVLRTVLKPVGINPLTGKRETARFIRAVVSPSYAAFSNVETVQTFLDTVGNHKVFRYNLSDSGMVMRVIDPTTARDGLEVGKEYKCNILGNSETGQSRWFIGSGLFQILCLNGLVNHRETSELALRHIDRRNHSFADRVLEGLQITNTANSQLMEDFRSAQSIVIDQAHDWMTNILGSMQGITQSTVAAVGEAMKDDTSGEVGTLQNVVNGMTLLSHSPDYGTELDLWDQIALEKAASKVLAKGIRQATDNRLYAPKIEA